ncbi:DUF3943 domain-containing protein [Colwellia sp. E2M01]|uniref:DUF3943 domain-containing protein n=1 Tax=Colwellia sp. E2M01 TaxID=2841561 RepID=UPI001C089455|nr:DUF3943 domain-containing protein [Colwellia sp. E2M01]MBU2872336.1 DUF3943 domain-containing protein [Colwellia sp. E2M01]
MIKLQFNKNFKQSYTSKRIALAVSLSTIFLLPTLLSNQAIAETTDSIATSTDGTATKQTSVTLTPAVNAENLDDIYREHATNTRWENVTITPSFYDSPYQVSLFSAENGENQARLWSQTKAVFGYGFGVIGMIALLPEDISNWDSEESLFSKWSDNVQDGPVWDRDTGMLNLIGHPYFGGAYYQVARKSGYRQWDSFVYSALMSTFYWEYGIESFAEIPSVQDLVITPVLGWAYGEWAFNTEMSLRESGGEIWGSSMLGNTALFFLDPVDYMSAGINNIFGKQIIIAGTGYVGVKEIPYGDEGQTDNQVSLNVSFQLGDGNTLSSASATKSAYRKSDPVDTGIIGLSYGAGTTQLDSLWGVEGGITKEYSLGLYFSPQFSSRVSYSKGLFLNEANNKEETYETFSLDSQYYFNSEGDFRPYLTAGFGDVLWKKEDESAKFQVNAGAGLHYKITNNFALQLDGRSYYSPNVEASDNNATLRLIYFLGKGQRN